MRSITNLPFLLICALLISACKKNDHSASIRLPVDTIGFAQYGWQVDSVLARTERLQSGQFSKATAVFNSSETLRVAISPHDDYSYVGYLYPAMLQHVK